MAGKIPLKTAAIIFLCCGIFIILSACISPVDMDAFFKNENVGNYINTVNNPPVITPPTTEPPTTPPPETPVVKVDNKTGDNLKGVNGKIEGLDPNKYYMVEKATNADGDLVEDSYPKYVTDKTGLGPGELFDFDLITKIDDGCINNLQNSYTYTVRAAESFQNGIIRYTDARGTEIKQIRNGVLDIASIKGKGYLDLSSALLDNTYKANAVYADKKSPWWFWLTSVTSDSWDSFELEGANNKIDYVFVNINDYSDFKVLTVNIGPNVIDIPAIIGVTPPVYGATPVQIITETAQYTGLVEWSPAINPGEAFAGSTDYTAKITLTAKPGYTLTGVPANFFTVAGTSPAATNLADSGIITAKFPKTAAPVMGNAAITINFSIDEIASTVTPSTATINRGSFGGGTQVNLTLTAPTGGGTWDRVIWSIDGISDTVVATHVNVGVLTIDNSADFWPVLMNGTINVYVTGVKNGKTYSPSNFVTITVDP